MPTAAPNENHLFRSHYLVGEGGDAVYMDSCLTYLDDVETCPGVSDEVVNGPMAPCKNKSDDNDDDNDDDRDDDDHGDDDDHDPITASSCPILYYACLTRRLVSAFNLCLNTRCMSTCNSISLPRFFCNCHFIASLNRDTHIVVMYVKSKNKNHMLPITPRQAKQVLMLNNSFNA
jgi:hypothetical protein